MGIGAIGLFISGCGGRTELQNDFTTPTDADIADTATLDSRPFDARSDVIVHDARPDSDSDPDPPTCPRYDVIGDPLRITHTDLLSAEPDLVSDGSDFALVWEEELDHIDFRTAIFLALISADGELISDLTPLSDDTADSRYPTIIWTGSEYGISWVDNAWNEALERFDYIAYFRSAAPDGLPLGIPLPISNVEETHQVEYATLAWNGARYGAVWCDDSSGIYFSQLGEGHENTLIAETELCQPKNLSLQWTGSEYASTWMDYLSAEFDLGLFFTRFLSSGELISHDNIIEVGEPGILRHSLAWTGSEFGLAWDNRSSSAYFSRLSADGIPIDSPIRLNSADGYADRPDLIWTGHEYGLVWSESRDGTRQIYFTRISSAGIADPPMEISGSSSSAHSPALTWNNNNFGVAWGDTRDTNREIYFTQVGCRE